jgi:DNA repair protein SbcC/Rad50
MIRSSRLTREKGSVVRPVLLNMTGFASFRDPARIDFRDVDYFVLVGPTGSGKSTVIDAITFALYGSVPRWDDRRTVSLALAPTVTRGTVRLLFDVDGSRYVVARELHRAASGSVQVRNARLERLIDPTGLGDEGEETNVLAADSEVTEAVESLLGLPYKHFITCVVLPQGNFAEFLLERPAKRQEILIKLLGLGIYKLIGQQANAEASIQSQRVDMVVEQIRQYADATEEAEDQANQRVEVLEGLVTKVQAALPRLRAASSKVTVEEGTASRLTAERRDLLALRAPDGLDELDARQRSKSDALKLASDQVEQAEQVDTAARKALAEAPARGRLEQVRGFWNDLAEIEDELPTARANKEALREASGDCQAHMEQGRVHLRELTEARDAAQRTELVAALRPHLEIGERCPVCEQPVATLPAAVIAPALDAAEAAYRHAEEDVRQLEAEWDVAMGEARTAAANVATLEQRADRLRTTLSGAPDLETVVAQLAELDRLESDRRSADESLRRARIAKAKAEKAAVEVKEELAAAWSAFDTARDRLVPLGAPALPRDDLASTWATLLAWAKTAADERKQAQQQASQRVAAARSELARTEQDLLTAFSTSAITPDQARPLVETAEATAATALEAARHSAARIRERRIEVGQLEDQRRSAAEAHQVAKELGMLLRADAFQRWLLAAALDVLVADASTTLMELTGGQFELTHEDGEFLVVDHADADSRRPVKTLSGGETFQASLSLALALSAQLRSMAPRGAAKLDSLFLDEGFGTLDEATLEVVASTLENLATSGDRMVGLVTHVGTLADRVPIRFTVRRDQRTSTVTPQNA